MLESIRLAADDIAAGFRLWRVWLTMAGMDIKLKYRRTVLGPLWVPVTFIVTIGLMGFIWATIFNMAMKQYLPYLACGLSLWFFLSALVGEAPITFVAAKALAQQSNLPLSFHIYRKVAYMTMNFLHNILAVAVIMAVFRVPLGAGALWAIPGLAMLLVFGVWLTLFVAAVCLRYRDLTQGITIIIGILPLVTPIYYYADMLKKCPWIYELNPLYHFLEICRAPLLGMPFPLFSWEVALAINAAGAMLALLFFAKVRPRLAYWM